MTHTVNKITDEPHLIGTCSGGKLVVFDGLDCRITINGEGALDAANEIRKCVNLHDELVEAIIEIRSLICDAAETGFNSLDGDWATKLYYTNARTYEALKKAGAL